MKNSRWACSSAALTAWILLILGLTAVARAWSVDEPLAGRSPETAKVFTQNSQSSVSALTATNCRYGASQVPAAWQSLPWLPTLAAGWYANFTHFEPVGPTSEFVFTIRLRQLYDESSGARLAEYTVTPKLVDYYEENGHIQPGLGHFVKSRPGALWLVGNEIEIDNTRQDNIMPDLYARAYHEIYHYIKGIDPTAQVAIGSVTMGTPGRLQYLDIVWNTYQARYGMAMPVDVWNFHIYILPERTMSIEPHYADGKIALGTDPNLALYSTNDPKLCPSPALPDVAANDPRPDVYCKAEHDSVRVFGEQVYNLRRWMKAHGQQDKPLIISEYGSLFAYVGGQPDGTCERRQDEFGQCMYPERVSKYLRGTAAFMENAKDPELGYSRDDFRLVQRWLWYSMYTPELVGDSSHLLVDGYEAYPQGSPDALTMMGQAFRDEALSHATQNLVASEAKSATVFVPSPGERGEATLTASFHNGGTYSIVAPFRVTFYSDAALTKTIGSVEVDPTQSGPVAGCTWTEVDRTASVLWTGLPVGTHSYWAKIDSSAQINETMESDNVTTAGVVTVYSSEEFSFDSYLPIARGD